MPKRKKNRARRVERRKSSRKLAFNHAMEYVADVPRALEFYAGKLGFRVIQKESWGGSVLYARIRPPAGSTTIALHKLDPGMKPPEAHGIRLYFEVAGLERFCKRLAATGVKFKQMPKKMPWGWKHAYLDDPDGHEISLYWSGEKRLRA